jgi:hypothetical protein
LILGDSSLGDGGFGGMTEGGRRRVALHQGVATTLGAVADVAGRTFIRARVLADSVASVGQALASHLVRGRALADGVGTWVEGIGLRLWARRAVGETVTLVETAVRWLTLRRSFSDSYASFTDAVVRPAMNYMRQQFEGVVFFYEGVGRNWYATLGDAVASVGDAVVMWKGKWRQLGDSVASIVDASVRRVPIAHRVANDGVPWIEDGIFGFAGRLGARIRATLRWFGVVSVRVRDRALLLGGQRWRGTIGFVRQGSGSVTVRLVPRGDVLLGVGVVARSYRSVGDDIAGAGESVRSSRG